MNTVHELSTQAIVMLVFSSLISAVVLSKIIYRIQSRKNKLIERPIPANRSISAKPFLANRFIGIALSKSIQKNFTRIDDISIKAELFSILRKSVENSNFVDADVNDITEVFLTEAISHDEPIKTYLRNINSTFLSELRTLVDDISTPRIKREELLSLVSFCLHSVELMESKVYA